MVIFGAITGTVAHFKGRNVAGWAALGFICGIGLLGFVPVIIVACLPNVKEQAARDAYIAEENRRLREQLRQERIKSESFRQHATARLDAHDQHLGLDTKTAGPALGGGIPVAGQLGMGGSDAARWFYGARGQTNGPVKASEMAALIRKAVVTRETLVWSEDLADWQPAGQVFAAQFRAGRAGPAGGSAYDLAQPGAAQLDAPRWYYGRDGRTLGPVKAAEIAEFIRLQIITRDTLLWSEELADWQPAGQIGVFAENFG